MGYEAVEENLPNCFCSPQAEPKLEAQDQVENEVICKVCFSKLSVISENKMPEITLTPCWEKAKMGKYYNLSSSH